MAVQHDDDLLGQPTVIALRIVFTAIGLVALALGYVGHARFLQHHAAHYGNRPWDIMYYDFQLFVLGSNPLQEPGPLPLSLQVARFAAPIVTIYAFIEGFRLVSAAELRRLRARNSRGHVVVSGNTPLADSLSRRLRAEGRRVVTIRATPADPAMETPSSGLLMVLGDARDPAVLRAAGVGRATALYACHPDSAANIAAGLAAGRIRRSPAQPLMVYAHVRDPDLCLTLQARYLGLPQPPRLRLEFFNVDDAAARKLFVDEPLARDNDQSPELLIAGDTPFARAVVVEAARHWQRSFAPDSAVPLHLTLVSETAGLARDQLSARYPFLDKVCQFSLHNGDLRQLLASGTLRDPPSRAFICYDDEEHALKTAMTAKQFWRSGPQSVMVRLDQLAAFRDGLDPTGHGRLFAEASGPLRAYAVTDAASDPGLISEDLVERLARVIHDRYRAARLLQGDTPRNNMALVSWDELPEPLRQSNREQAEDIGRKLRAIGCVIIPRLGPAEDGVLRDAEIEQLAVMEHERWRARRTAAGWEYAQRRDDTRKHHPALRDWPELPPQMRSRNHDAVREVPMILADAGFQIIRL